MVSFTGTRGRILGMPWWAAVTAMFVVGRIVSTLFLLWYAGHQNANPWTSADPSIWDFASIWDGRWYNLIATLGYPTVLPHDPSGHVIENAWAFLPLYPMVVKFVMAATGLAWNYAAVGVSVLCALAATLVFYRLMIRFLNKDQAFFAVVLFSLAPVSPLFQVAYAESMQILLIAIALLLLVRRNYLSIIPVALLLGVTRPGALALALTLALHFVYRMWGSRRRSFRWGERWRVIAAIVAAGLGGFEWMLIAGWVTGLPNAYLQTELAWRAPYIGWKELVPFTPWIEATQWWWHGLAGWLILAAVVLGFVLLLVNPAAKRIGVDLRLWTLSYSVYVFAVFFPQSSTMRILAPLFPALGMFAVPRSKIYRWAAIVVCVLLQWFWIHFMWAVDGSDWSPP